jgi:hypothetical protein
MCQIPCEHTKQRRPEQMDDLHRPFICSEFMCIGVREHKKYSNLCDEDENIIDDSRNTDRMFVGVWSVMVVMRMRA